MAATDCFDLAKATRAIKVVPLDVVIDPLEVTHAPDRVDGYADAMRRGERFPPISAVPIAGRFLVTDGHKRLAAFRQLGAGEIPVQLWTPFMVVREQWRQTRDHYGRGLRILLRCPREKPARREALIFLRSEAEHYVRLARSFARLLRRRGAV